MRPRTLSPIPSPIPGRAKRALLVYIGFCPMSALTPSSPEELAAALGAAASDGRTICLGGHFSKRRMAGHLAAAEVTISTAGLNHVLQYEPKDLTISVDAGLPWCELTRLLAADRQMMPLDPPFGDTATVGGVVAVNHSGPRRRLYGTARDFVIGMKFATLEGKLIQSGGMVVKNVAGLDMAKLMIGSFGTLAAIAVVNFKLVPMPAGERSFLLSFDSAGRGPRSARRDSAQRPATGRPRRAESAGAAVLGRDGYVLAIGAGGNAATLDRYDRELAALGAISALDGPAHAAFWRSVQHFTPDFLERNASGTVIRVSTPLTEIRAVLDSLPVAAIARAGSGVCYAHFDTPQAAAEWLPQAARSGWKAVMEFAPEDRAGFELWPAPGNDFGVIERVKEKFDPHRLLNRGRLYNRI